MIQLYTYCCVGSSLRHFEFSKVVQAHTLGELSSLCKFMLRVYSGTFLPIFIIIIIIIIIINIINVA